MTLRSSTRTCPADRRSLSSALPVPRARANLRGQPPMRLTRFLVLLFAFAALSASGLLAQQPLQAKRDDTALGAKLASVPDLLYAHISELKPGQGLLVESIKPGSRAAEIGL